MLASQRHARILEQINAFGAVRVADLVAELGVSDMTIRRDIEQLARRGLLERVHGGAVASGDQTDLIRAQPSADEPGFAAKSHLMQRAKAAIAREAAGLVEPGAAIALSAGTTTVALARELRGIPGLTIVTNSVPAAQILAGTASSSDHTVVLTGGTRTPSEALVGPIAVQALRGLHVDLVFLGVHGLDLKAGLTTPNLVEAETNRALIESGRSLCVVADHTKWGIVGLGTIVGLDCVSTLVTDAGLPREARESVAEIVARLVVADVPAQVVRTSTGPVG